MSDISAYGRALLLALGFLAAPLQAAPIVHPSHAAPGPVTKETPVGHLPEQALTIKTHDGQSHGFTVEVAIRPADQERGLMYRKTLADGHGMLFVWPAPREVDMWMRNTYVPLDIVFINAQRKVAAVSEDTVPLSEAFISGHGPAAAVLELPAHTTAKRNIRVGDTVISEALAEHGP